MELFTSLANNNLAMKAHANNIITFFTKLASKGLFVAYCQQTYYGILNKANLTF